MRTPLGRGDHRGRGRLALRLILTTYWQTIQRGVTSAPLFLCVSRTRIASNARKPISRYITRVKRRSARTGDFQRGFFARGFSVRIFREGCCPTPWRALAELRTYFVHIPRTYFVHMCDICIAHMCRTCAPWLAAGVIFGGCVCRGLRFCKNQIHAAPRAAPRRL